MSVCTNERMEQDSSGSSNVVGLKVGVVRGWIY